MLGLKNCYFQQDGAPAHYTRKVRDYLNQLFLGRWIGCRDPLEWAARSPDLTPCDFFLWGFLNPLSVSYFFKESVEIVLYHVKIEYFKLYVIQVLFLCYTSEMCLHFCECVTCEM